MLAIDFGLLPPEINSARMYAGAGPGPLLTAAAAWDGLAEELYSAASSYGSVVSGLTSGAWQGPASASMVAAVTPYVAWMSATAAQAELAGIQAKVAAGAYETAFAATVHPAVIAANRAQLMMLIATNFLGQNTPAIAATETQYAEMWAQDAATMYSYAGTSATATQLTPFTSPLPITSPGGLSGQAAALAQATATSTATNTQAVLSQLTSEVPTALQGLASPLQAISAATPSTSGLTGILQSLGLTSPLGYADGSLSSVGLATGSGASGSATHADAAIISTQDQIAGTEARIMGRLNQLGPVAAVGSAGSAGLGVGGGPTAVSADLGGAASVGTLSVPQSWAVAAPPIRLAAAALPGTGAGAASEVEAGGSGNLLGEMMLASMATRAMGGIVSRARPTVIPRSPAAG
jgi:PPE-repeat protein